MFGIRSAGETNELSVCHTNLMNLLPKNAVNKQKLRNFTNSMPSPATKNGQAAEAARDHMCALVLYYIEVEGEQLMSLIRGGGGLIYAY